MLQRRESFIVVLVLTFFSLSSFATTSDYYTIQETTAVQESSLDPLESFNAVVRTFAKNIDEQFLSLMIWQHHPENLESPAAPYNRLKHYGTWVRPVPDSCQNTRAQVLIRQSEVPVTFSRSGCTVVSGKWLDPYSSLYYNYASDLDIDHMVPLKNSYVSGAWKWDSKKRCLYANFMENDFQLIAIKSEDNRQKGDSTPEKFMPRDPSYRCDYLANWLKIKLIWNLAMSSSEAHAIEELARQNHCEASLLSYKFKDLNGQRRRILEKKDLCF